MSIEITTRSIGGHWHMVVREPGKPEERYPAESETVAELMVRFEKRDRGMPVS